MKDIERIIKEEIDENGWHISDGVDGCSGEDEEEQVESKKRLVKAIEQYVEKREKKIRDNMAEIYIDRALNHKEDVIKARKKQVEEIGYIDCSNCDNQGFTVKQTSEKQYVTKDMATDACEPEMEGQLYSDDEFEQEQCQWCYEFPISKFNYDLRIAQLNKALANETDTKSI